jgi:hypothetical protein
MAVIYREDVDEISKTAEMVKMMKKTAENAMPLTVATDLVKRLMSAVASRTMVIEAMPNGIS